MYLNIPNRSAFCLQLNCSASIFGEIYSCTHRRTTLHPEIQSGHTVCIQRARHLDPNPTIQNRTDIDAINKYHLRIEIGMHTSTLQFVFFFSCVLFTACSRLFIPVHTHQERTEGIFTYTSYLNCALVFFARIRFATNFISSSASSVTRVFPLHCFSFFFDRVM